MENISRDEKLYQPNNNENFNEPKYISLQPEKLHVTVQSNQFNSSKYKNSSQDVAISIPSNDLQNNKNQNLFEKKNKFHQNQQYQTTTHILSDINNKSNKLAKSGSPLSIQQINQDDLLSIEQQQYKNVYGNQGTQNKELNQCVEKQHNLEIYQEDVRIENYILSNQKIEDNKAIQNIIHKDEEPHIEVRIENYLQNNQKIKDNKAIQNIIHTDEKHHIIQPTDQPIVKPIVQPTSVIQQDKLSILQKIIDETSKKRAIADEYKYYIRRLQDKSELKKNYGLGLQASVKLYQYCNSFREVRGDGNCFYTAFGCQFLSILLFDYSYNQFQNFINRIRQDELPMKIFVTGTDLKIDDKELEKQLLEEFLNRLTQLKQIEDINQRQEQFLAQFAAYEKQSEDIDGCLYGLSTIFFRNYSNYILEFSDYKDAVFDRENLLKWEEECNSNEFIIAELAEHLNLFIQLIFIGGKDNIMVNEYGKLDHHKIILLIKPGHYNIGYYQQENIIDQYIELIQKFNGKSCQESENEYM